MSASLFEPCPTCYGSGEFRGGAVLVFDPEDADRVAKLAEQGICLMCAGQRYLPIGLTAGQVENLIRQRAALRSLVERAVNGRIDNEWLAEARRTLQGRAKAGQTPGGGR